MVILAVAVAFFIVEKIFFPPIDPEPAIVVLPFEGIDLPLESENLPDTFAEGIYTSLARVPQLVVSAWPTVNRLAEEGMDADEIVETLNAANSLRGTIEVTGNRVDITARIIATESNRTIWEKTLSGTTSDFFDIHNEIVAAVVERLQLGAVGTLYKSRPANPDAQRLVMQAWSTLNRVNMQDRGKIAAALLRQALEIDPDYVPALNLLSYATFRQVGEGTTTPDDAEIIYKEIQERVAAVDHEDGLQNAYNAWGLFWDDDEPAHSNQHLQIALRTGLNDGEALRLLAGFARRTGNGEAAVWFGERAVAIDPTCENCVWQKTENLFYAGRFEKAIAAKKQFQAFGGGGFGNHAYMLLRLGQPQAALDLISESAADPEYWYATRAMAHHALGDTDKFEVNIASLAQQENWGAQMDLAMVYAFTGNLDLAFAALETVLRMGGPLQYEIFLPQWDNLRDDLRWTEIRERAGMPEQKVGVLDFSPVLRFSQQSSEL